MLNEQTDQNAALYLLNHGLIEASVLCSGEQLLAGLRLMSRAVKCEQLEDGIPNHWRRSVLNVAAEADSQQLDLGLAFATAVLADWPGTDKERLKLWIEHSVHAARPAFNEGGTSDPFEHKRVTTQLLGTETRVARALATELDRFHQTFELPRFQKACEAAVRIPVDKRLRFVLATATISEHTGSDALFSANVSHLAELVEKCSVSFEALQQTARTLGGNRLNDALALAIVVADHPKSEPIRYLREQSDGERERIAPDLLAAFTILGRSGGLYAALCHDLDRGGDLYKALFDPSSASLELLEELSGVLSGASWGNKVISTTVPVLEKTSPDRQCFERRIRQVIEIADYHSHKPGIHALLVQVLPSLATALKPVTFEIVLEKVIEFLPRMQDPNYVLNDLVGNAVPALVRSYGDYLYTTSFSEPLFRLLRSLHGSHHVTGSTGHGTSICPEGRVGKSLAAVAPILDSYEMENVVDFATRLALDQLDPCNVIKYGVPFLKQVADDDSFETRLSHLEGMVRECLGPTTETTQRDIHWLLDRAPEPKTRDCLVSYKACLRQAVDDSRLGARIRSLVDSLADPWNKDPGGTASSLVSCLGANVPRHLLLWLSTLPDAEVEFRFYNDNGDEYSGYTGYDTHTYSYQWLRQRVAELLQEME